MNKECLITPFPDAKSFRFCCRKEDRHVDCNNHLKTIIEGLKVDKSLLLISDVAFNMFFPHLLLLLKHNIKNGEKYFEQCLKWKPFYSLEVY